MTSSPVCSATLKSASSALMLCMSACAAFQLYPKMCSWAPMRRLHSAAKEAPAQCQAVSTVPLCQCGTGFADWVSEVQQSAPSHPEDGLISASPLLMSLTSERSSTRWCLALTSGYCRYSGCIRYLVHAQVIVKHLVQHTYIKHISNSCQRWACKRGRHGFSRSQLITPGQATCMTN